MGTIMGYLTTIDRGQGGETLFPRFVIVNIEAMKNGLISGWVCQFHQLLDLYWFGQT